MKTPLLFAVLLVSLLVVTVWVAPASAGYIPTPEFLAKMEAMLKLAPSQKLLRIQDELREVRAGAPYQEGDEAAFILSSGVDPGNNGIALQLAEWRMQPEGHFLVTYTKMWPTTAVRWRVRFSPTGTVLLGPGEGIPDEALDISSPEVVRASEMVQELLSKFGRPVGGKEV